MTATPPPPLTDEQLAERIAAASRNVKLRLGPNALGMAQRGEPIILSGNEADELADAVRAIVQPELDRLRAERDQARAQLAGVWPCTCGHLPDQHKYDPTIGRNFCRSCPTDTDLHNYEPAAGES